MIQCKTPVTPRCNNLSLAEKRPVRIKSPITRIQYLREVPGFRSAGHISFLFYGRSTARNGPFHFYRIFRSYVEIIADSAINGFECDEQFFTLHIFARERAIDAE